jgi:hypothetical protein
VGEIWLTPVRPAAAATAADCYVVHKKTSVAYTPSIFCRARNQGSRSTIEVRRAGSCAAQCAGGWLGESGEDAAGSATRIGMADITSTTSTLSRAARSSRARRS